MLSSLPRISDIAEASDGHLSVQHAMGSGDPYVSQASMLITVLHDGTKIPDAVREVFDGGEQTLNKYVSVERDVGTSELGDRLRKLIPGILVLHVEPPRGIVDVNRLQHCAIPIVFPSQVSREIQERLLLIHAKAVDALNRAIDGTKNASAAKGRLILDLHSMSPRSPLGKVPVTQWDHLDAHVTYWREGANSGTVRPLDIIDATEEGEIIGNRDLALDLRNAFVERGFPAALNEPYAKSRAHHPMFIEGRGVSPDFSKPMLTAWDPLRGFDLVDCTADDQKIANIANIVKDVVLRHS